MRQPVVEVDDDSNIDVIVDDILVAVVAVLLEGDTHVATPGT